MDHTKQRSYGFLGVGFFLLIAGVVLMLDKFDIFYVGSIWHYWPIIFIAMGLGRLLDARIAYEYGKAFWMLFIGCWFLTCELHLFGLRYHNAWPILLIGIGISMLWKSFYSSQYKLAKDHCHGH